MAAVELHPDLIDFPGAFAPPVDLISVVNDLHTRHSEIVGLDQLSARAQGRRRKTSRGRCGARAGCRRCGLAVCGRSLRLSRLCTWGSSASCVHGS